MGIIKRPEAILHEAAIQIEAELQLAERAFDNAKSGSKVYYESWGRFNGLAYALGTINRLRGV